MAISHCAQQEATWGGGIQAGAGRHVAAGHARSSMRWWGGRLGNHVPGDQPVLAEVGMDVGLLGVGVGCGWRGMGFRRGLGHELIRPGFDGIPGLAEW